VLYKPEDNPLRALEEELPFQQLATIMPLAEGKEDDDETKKTLDNIVRLLIELVRQRTGIVVDESRMWGAVVKMRKFKYYINKFTNGTQSGILKEVLAIDNGLMPLVCSYIFEHPVVAHRALFTASRICDYAHLKTRAPSARDYKVSCSLVVPALPSPYAMHLLA
jgi:hypothetical protein